MIKTSSKTKIPFLLALSFAGLVSCGFIQLPAYADTISQFTIDQIDLDLKDSKKSGRDFSKEITELKATVESKDASPALKATCYRLLSGISSNVNNMDESLQYIEKAYELDPKNREILVQRAFAHTMDADREKAIEYYQEAITAHPELSWLYFNRAGMLQGIDRHKEAIEDFDKAISLSKNDQKAFAIVLKIQSLMLLAQFKAVLEAGKDVSIENLPAELKMNFLKAVGYSQLRESQFEDGIKTLTQALGYATTDKEKAIIYRFRSIGYYKLNQKTKADEDLDLAEKHGYRAPNSPPPDRMVKFNNELNEALKPLIVKARATIPEAKKRYLAGLPKGHFMSITTVIRDKNGRSEQVFVNVRSWVGDTVTGDLANDVALEGYKKRQELKVNEKDMLDWTIVNSKGEEEGNVLGKFIDKWIDEHQKKQNGSSL